MSFLPDDLKSWVKENPGKAWGIGAGALIGILIFTFGIVKLLLIILLMIFGYVIGKSFDEGVPIVEVIKRILKR